MSEPEEGLKRWGGRITITASVTLEFDDLDKLEAVDEEHAKERMIRVTKEAFREGNYDYDNILVEDIYECGNEGGK